jgi:hypothetical protein
MEDADEQENLVELTFEETRVLGSLIEKELNHSRILSNEPKWLRLTHVIKKIIVFRKPTWMKMK